MLRGIVHVFYTYRSSLESVVTSNGCKNLEQEHRDFCISHLSLHLQRAHLLKLMILSVE